MSKHCVIGRIEGEVVVFVEAESNADAVEMVRKMNVKKLLEDADPPELFIVDVSEVKEFIFYDDIEE